MRIFKSLFAAALILAPLAGAHAQALTEATACQIAMSDFEQQHHGETARSRACGKPLVCTGFLSNVTQGQARIAVEGGGCNYEIPWSAKYLLQKFDQGWKSTRTPF
jgi:hypothetical protein